MNSKTRVFNDYETFTNFINEVLNSIEYSVESREKNLVNDLLKVYKREKLLFYCNDKKSSDKLIRDLNNISDSEKLIFIYDDRVNNEKNKNKYKERPLRNVLNDTESTEIEASSANEDNLISIKELVEQLRSNNKVFMNDEIDELVKIFKIPYINSMKIERLINNSNLENKITKEDFYDYNKVLLTQLSMINPTALVLGAGISIDAGAKGWDAMMNSFKDELKIRNITSQPSALEETIGNSNLINAQMFKEVLNNDSDYFKKINENLYGGMKDFSDQILIYYVCKLINKWKNNNFFRVMTYNFDDYLERYLDRFFNQCKYHIIFTPEILNNNLNIYHVHGFLPNKDISNLSGKKKESIILTEDDYNKLYNNAYAWQISTQLSFFRENICLFIGCGLTDPNIRRLLKMSSSKGTHFAFMRGGHLSVDNIIIATNHFYNLGVRIIWVDNFNEYSDIVADMSK